MNAKNLFKKSTVVWKNRRKILQGLWYSVFPNHFVESVANTRYEVCKLNACGFYDKEGKMEATVLKGMPACGGCGCTLAVKCRSLSSWCYLKDIGKIPLWDSIMTPEKEEKFRKRHNIS